MIRSILFYSIALLFTSYAGVSQNYEMMLNARPYDVERYDDVTGSAYMWDEPVLVTLISLSQDPVKNVLGNYNMAEGEFEVYKDKEYIVLNKLEYPIIEYVNSDGEVTTLISIPNPELNFGYCIQHHKEVNFLILETKRKRKSEVIIQTPGKTNKLNKFKKSSDYYIIKSGKLIKFKPSSKKIAKEFGHKKEIKKFIKSNDLKVKKVKDAVVLLKYMNEQGWIK